MYPPKVSVLEFVFVLKITSRKAGIINVITKIHTNSITNLDFICVRKSCKNEGLNRDNALLKAINDSAIQSTLANIKASITEPTHHPSPNCHSCPKYTWA